jgi:hypothetical protein
MPIRTYQPGDEQAQARIYNTVACPLPGFKPTSAEEIARRYQAVDPEPTSKLYAVEDGQMVGYIVFNPNGRISYPWCLAEYQTARDALLGGALGAMSTRRYAEAWTTYRADWSPVLEYFQEHGFVRARAMINYIAKLDRLPDRPLPSGRIITPLERQDLPRLLELEPGLFAGCDPKCLGLALWENPHFSADGLFALRDDGDGTLLGAALIIANAAYADPSKLDAAMPCFRLGAFGTESQRHKRVNGLFAAVFADEHAGELLLSEAARRLGRLGLTHIAAQAPSNVPSLCAFFDSFFDRQGEFPILVRPLSLGVSTTKE